MPHVPTTYLRPSGPVQSKIGPAFGKEAGSRGSFAKGGKVGGGVWPFQQKDPAIRVPYRRYREGMAPIIPLKVRAGKRWRTILTYVDSGAAYSILTVKEARRLGLLKIKARRVAVTTSSGRTQSISLHRLWVKLEEHRFSVTFGVPRGFDVDFNLLGRRDLFRRYVVSFDDTHGFVTFSSHRRS